MLSNPCQDLSNPVFRRADFIRDPAIMPDPSGKGYHLYYTRYSNRGWVYPENWAVACIWTEDFKTFSHDRDLSPKGFASPGDPLQWHGRWVLPLQSYPVHPGKLYYMESDDLNRWSEVKPMLHNVIHLPWNDYTRSIDANFIVHEDWLYCFFVGSVKTPSGRANALGLARTQDPQLSDWEIISQEKPLLGASAAYPDGVENVIVFPCEGRYIMIYSAGLKQQRVAWLSSTDLIHWQDGGPIQLETQHWNARKHGAPCVWKEGDTYYLLLMGEENEERCSSLGLATSQNGIDWQLIPANAADAQRGSMISDDLAF